MADLSFSYLPNTEFRRLLASDFEEAHKCYRGECWKAATVMYGSATEGLLWFALDALGKQPKKSNLQDLIKAAAAVGLVEGASEQMCTMIRSWRNLVHIENGISNGSEANEHTAMAARALALMVADSIAKNFLALRGASAEALAELINSMPSENPEQICPLDATLKSMLPSELDRYFTTLVMARRPSNDTGDIDDENEYLNVTEAISLYCYEVRWVIHRAKWPREPAGWRPVIDSLLKAVRKGNTSVAWFLCEVFLCSEMAAEMTLDEKGDLAVSLLSGGANNGRKSRLSPNASAWLLHAIPDSMFKAWASFVHYLLRDIHSVAGGLEHSVVASLRALPSERRRAVQEDMWEVSGRHQISREASLLSATGYAFLEEDDLPF